MKPDYRAWNFLRDSIIDLTSTPDECPWVNPKASAAPLANNPLTGEIFSGANQWGLTAAGVITNNNTNAFINETQLKDEDMSRINPARPDAFYNIIAGDNNFRAIGLFDAVKLGIVKSGFIPDIKPLKFDVAAFDKLAGKDGVAFSLTERKSASGKVVVVVPGSGARSNNDKIAQRIVALKAPKCHGDAFAVWAFLRRRGFNTAPLLKHCESVEFFPIASQADFKLQHRACGAATHSLETQVGEWLANAQVEKKSRGKGVAR